MNETLSKEKEVEIIKAARKVFSRYGFSKTTMEDIAAEIEMGKASLYYYFPTKENLFQAAVMQEQEEFLTKITDVLSKQKSSSERLRTYVEERLLFFQSLINLGTLSFKALSLRQSLSKKMYLAFAEKEIELIKGIISDGKKSGEFASDVNLNTAVLLIHIIQGLRIRAIQKSDSSGLDPKEYKELKTDMMNTIEIFIKGIKNTGRVS